MRSAVGILFLLLTTAPAAAAGEAVKSGSLKTVHYDLYAENADVADLGRLAEALYAHLAVYFGKAPDGGPLRVELYATRARFEDALRADKQLVVHAGGYYAPQTRKAYLWREPSDYFTRHLFLHELAHQFHYLVATRNRSPRAEWYTEGLAEYFGMHNWDGRALRVGVIPAVSLEDYPAAAQKEFEAAKYDLTAVVAGDAPPDRPLAWAVFRFLHEREPGVLKELATRLDAGAGGAGAWQAAAGERSAELAKAFAVYLGGLQQPFKVATVAWEQRGDDLLGTSPTTATALIKRPGNRVVIDVSTDDVRSMPGVVLEYVSGDEYATVQAMPDGRVRLARRRRGKWLPPEDLPAPTKRPKCVVTLQRAGDRWRVSVNGQFATTLSAAGDVGLSVQEGSASFRVR